MQAKQISLNETDFIQKAKDDLPCLKDLEMLNKNCGSFALLDCFEKQMFDALQSGNLEIVDRLLKHWIVAVKSLNS